MEMEPAAAWAPCEFQLANWTLEEPAPGLPVEYASIDIPATSSLEAYVPETSGLQQQLLEYYNCYYSAPSQHSATIEKAKISNDSYARSVVNQVESEFKHHISMTKTKMHRYPACLGAVDESYTMPRIVAIGPYHHGRDHLKQAEMVKHVAACHCVRQSGCLLEELYGAVVAAADNARCLYHKDVMAGIGYDDFRHMMLFDACFLVQFMLMRGGSHTEVIDEGLRGFLSPNRGDIFHDIMLLENQLPWEVVKTVLGFMPLSSIPKNFVARKRHCMLPDDRHEPPPKQKPFVWDDSYKPPHLLALLRYYIVGRSSVKHEESIPKNVSASISAMELAEIGITVTANKTWELIDMRLNQKGAFFSELSLAPLSLDRDRASYLVNMAALELCTVKSFGMAPEEDSAVCSYLLLLAKLVYREEDVHELRVRGLLQGGGGLTNEEALRFFTSFQGLRFGSYYFHIMVQIERYRDSSRMKTKLVAFFYNHKKTIAAVVTGVGAVGGIIGTLLSIKKTF